jgi:hypothetical protein
MRVLLRFTKLFFRFTWHIAAFIVVLLLCFHFWFIYHSEKTIEDLITWASGGKLKSSIKKIKINYFDNNIDVKDLIIFNTDSSAQSTAYRFTTKNFHLKIRSRWDLIFHKQLLLDSVVFNNPDIIVTRSGLQKNDTTGKKLLLAEELGNVYKAITQSLNVLNLQRFEIIEGRVLIKDAGNTGRAPFRLSHIFLSVDKFNIDTSVVKDKSAFIFSERILLRINDQHILLPDNKSNISFKELLIDSKEKLVRIVNPAINILPQAQQKNSLIASAPLLSITGLDFNALYQRQLIKADSVFLDNPKGISEIYMNEKNAGDDNKKKTPIDSALVQLPVAINISHIVLQHGDGLLHLHQGNKVTSFQTKNDNISIAGIRINDSAGNILNIDGFNYTVRNYIGYTPDSIYRFGFDSLQFINNKIVLHHFTAATVKRTKATLVRDYTVPRFEITGMDWLSFILDNHFKAKNAVLYNPVLNIEKNIFFNDQNASQNRSKKSIYQTLSVMDSLLDLDQLKIVNGNFSFKQQNTLNLQLQHLNLGINADELTKAKSINQLVNSVKQLSFDTATANNLSGSLFISKSVFNNKEKNLLLNKVVLHTDDDNIDVGLNGVSLKDFSFNNNELEVNGIHWNEGTFRITAGNKKEKRNDKNKPPAFLLNNIEGNNTTVFFTENKTSAEINLKTIFAGSLIKENDLPFQAEGLLVAGNSAKINLLDSKFSCGEFVVRDKQKSFFQNILFEKKNSTDSVLIKVVQFGFIPSVNESIEKNTVTADSAAIDDASVFLAFTKNKNIETAEGEKLFPKLNINVVAVSDASVQLHFSDKENKTIADCKKLSLNIKSIITQKDNLLLANNFVLNAGDIFVNNNETLAVNAFRHNFFGINSFLYNPSTQSWQAQVDKFSNDSIQYTNKKSSVNINNLSAENAVINNEDLKSPLSWLVNHSKAGIRFSFAGWKNDNTNLELTGFQFNQNKKEITINSFSIDPAKTREDFIKNIIYREDYMQASSGKINIEGIEMNKGLLQIPYIYINDAALNVYSDKLKKPGEESLQPLPVPALLKMPLGVHVQKIELNNMHVDYTELNEDTRHTGNVYFTNINGNIFNVQSKPNADADSLRVNVYAKFLDTMKLHLLLNESYADSLHGLNLQVQLGSGDLRLLNSFLAPLVSMQAKSGYLDTMSMSAVGNEYFSQGNMRLYYHGLKADILDSGNLQKRKFGTKLINFFANTIAVKNGNIRRRADFHFVRIRQKSSISYFLKMIVQGAAGSVAPLTGIIYKKEYKRAVKKMAGTTR